VDEEVLAIQLSKIHCSECGNPRTVRMGLGADEDDATANLGHWVVCPNCSWTCDAPIPDKYGDIWRGA
jgi:hypothetical protein